MDVVSIRQLYARMQTLETEMRSLKESDALKDEKIKTLEESAGKMSKQIAEVASICVPDSICNLAAQIVLFWVNAQPKDFSSHSSPLHHVEQYVQTEIGKRSLLRLEIEVNQGKDPTEQMKADTIVKKLDEVVLRRNGKLHFSNWAALGKRVHEVQQFLKRYPDLTSGREDETFTISHFAHIRRARLTKTPS